MAQSGCYRTQSKSIAVRSVVSGYQAFIPPRNQTLRARPLAHMRDRAALLGEPIQATMKPIALPLAATATVIFLSTVAVGAAGLNRAPPRLHAAPRITGQAIENGRLRVSSGRWFSASALRFGYRWMRCPRARNTHGCTPIPGATGKTYRLASTDIGKSVTALVTTTNRWASARAFARPSPRVKSLPVVPHPSPSAAPTPRRPSPNPTPSPDPSASPSPSPTAPPPPSPPASPNAPPPTPGPPSTLSSGVPPTDGAASAGQTANLPVGIFVAPTGSDTSGDGSIFKPFATLAKAQATMRRGGPQVAYIRGGNYNLPAVTQNGISRGLYLTTADSGQTWSYYPPDGYDSAILDGGSTSSSTGIEELITIDGASHVTIDGLQLQHFRWVGVGVHGGGQLSDLFPVSTTKADSNTLANNIVHDGSYDTSPVSNYGGAAFYGEGDIPNTTMTNNSAFSVSASGLEVNAGLGGDISSLWIGNNVVLSTCLLIRDCGSIYVQDPSSTSANIRIANNFVRDSGTSTTKARSIYLDDGVSGAIVRNNISAGVFNFAFTIHGGSNNAISSNIVDLGPSNNREILLYQGDGLKQMTGNTVQSNLIVSGGGGGWYDGKSFGAQPDIRNNVYHQYAGAPIYSRGLNGLNGDATPVLVDPQLSCWTYMLAALSPVNNPPVSFISLPRAWALRATPCRRPARRPRSRIPAAKQPCSFLSAVSESDWHPLQTVAVSTRSLRLIPDVTLRPILGADVTVTCRS